MKKMMTWLLIFDCIFALAGCGASSAEKTLGLEFPLEESVVQSALEELSLPWVIFEEETRRISDADREAVSYTLRDPKKKQNEESETTTFYAGVLSGTFRGHRELDVVLDNKPLGLVGKPFSWEDWKQEIILATVLYGGTEDREEAYRTLSKMDVPEDDGFELGVSLSNGYCVIKRRALHAPENDRYILRIHFYESEALYRETVERIN